ncbi:hypothetical protein SRHO_G00164940 [Serrasalmus rhombeus]
MSNSLQLTGCSIFIPTDWGRQRAAHGDHDGGGLDWTTRRPVARDQTESANHQTIRPRTTVKASQPGRKWEVSNWALSARPGDISADGDVCALCRWFLKEIEMTV